MKNIETSELWGWATWTPNAGAELVSLVRELDGPFPDPAWVEGYGEVRDPVVLTQSDAGGRFERRLAGTWDLVTLRGSPRGDLYALLARDSAAGPQHIGGLLASALVVTTTLRVGAALPNVSRQPSPPLSPTPPPAVVESRLQAPPPPPPAPSSPGLPMPSLGSITSVSTPAPALPKRPIVRDTDDEVFHYPEEGDVVTHFAFGRCTVLFSDGERLRLQQERDGRVREVALSMLKIKPPASPDATPRHWDLARKN
ncbi:MAG: hypothetical protein HOW73_49660 [Polyangiaceae bacterium]|nr:hypothetical protein [Polyangiaceae bacterium]